LAYCNNCGRESHCGTKLTASEFQLGREKLPVAAEICSSCVCNECKGKECFTCKEKRALGKYVDYRDYKMDLKGRVYKCLECIGE